MTETFVRTDVRQFLNYLESLNRPKGHEIGAEGARRMMIASRHAFEPPAREIAVARDVVGPVPLRLYDTREEREPGPLLLFIHGGGWVLGDLDTHEPFCIDVAIGLNLPVIAVDYRLAPEHPFAAAVEDALRDEPADAPVLGQWLIYPATDPGVHHPSYDRFSDGHLLTKPGM